MEMYVTLEEAKKQIRGFVDYGDEDDVITDCILDAQAALETKLQRPLAECTDERGDLKRDLRRALKIAIGDFYDNRSDITFSKPYDIGLKASLTAPHIKFKGSYGTTGEDNV